MNGRICTVYRVNTIRIRTVSFDLGSDDNSDEMIILIQCLKRALIRRESDVSSNLFFLFRNTENKSDKEIHERNRWYGFRWWRITLGWSIVFYHRESDRKQIQSIHSRIIKENKDFFPWRLYWSTRRSTQSIIYASKKYMVDQNFTDNLLNLDRLKIKADYFYGSHLLFYSRCQWFKSHQNSIRSPGRNIRYCTVVFVPYF